MLQLRAGLGEDRRLCGHNGMFWTLDSLKLNLVLARLEGSLFQFNVSLLIIINFCFR